jgi:lipopolysaccharide transport system ATP-binding protein
LSQKNIISVKSVSKHYIIKHQLQHEPETLVGKWISNFKNIDQFRKNKSTELFKALNNVSFDIQRGDRIGIVGRNGAGKSTLLKILSRITPPTSGKIEIDGKLAALLEVGTGFHGDLTGRENIYLNGSILGMSKTEIDKKFDEIIAFAEVEQFLDTPVKRYSSGMYVRLAFAVAAHLEPEILIVDEVLAVGDASFQKKCLGKMNEVSESEGRTILFVSHNMGQIASLCNKGILLNKGQLEQEGPIQDIISSYFNTGAQENETLIQFETDASKHFQIKTIAIQNKSNVPTKEFAHDEPIHLDIAIEKHKSLSDVLLAVHFYDHYEKRIFTTQIPISDLDFNQGIQTFHLKIPESFLVPNTYKFTVGLHVPNIQLVDVKDFIGKILIYDNGSEFYKYPIGDSGLVFVKAQWHY